MKFVDTDGTVITVHFPKGEPKYFERVVCADGFSVSVQAQQNMYNTPRCNIGPFTEVECGFPSSKDWMLERYAEDKNAPIEDGKVQTVYAYVPIEVVLAVIRRHGGMVGGQLPPHKVSHGITYLVEQLKAAHK